LKFSLNDNVKLVYNEKYIFPFSLHKILFCVKNLVFKHNNKRKMLTSTLNALFKHLKVAIFTLKITRL